MRIEKSAGVRPARTRSRRPAIVFAVVLLVFSAVPALGQEINASRRDTTSAGNSASSSRPRWRFLHVNELETPFMSIRVGGGFLQDYMAFRQNTASKIQTGIITGVIQPPEIPIDRRPGPSPTGLLPRASRAKVAVQQHEDELGLDDEYDVRDSRFILGGRLFVKPAAIWYAGILYDTKKEQWLIRQTGIMWPVPELSSWFWIGRQKEGFSLSKVMTGYDGWTMERFTFSDASIPLLADGLRWLGYVPKVHLFWNVGAFSDWFSRGQTFSFYEHQVALRTGYVRMDSSAAGKLVHVALQFRAGDPTNDTLRLKSRPEASAAPDFIDTGKFHATAGGSVGVEAYYRSGSWLTGTEYYFMQAKSREVGEPSFNGGDIFVSKIFTGEVRPYMIAGSYFKAIIPNKSFWEGGPGAWEIVLRFSYSDLDSGVVRGGRFWRLTPQLNWYLNQNVRLEANYGYSRLYRFGLIGITQFFQLRLQTLL